ncbi:hypothetical protein PGQ11_013823 [Apiospora arundinis]|uniref:DUF202 domain-containing protein n=1 Tax=Apiospora arundinis TaxID=335852 RepID=A0ABR2HR32_9PEZI
MASAQEPHLHGSPPQRPHVQHQISEPSEPALELIDLASGAVVPSSRPGTPPQFRTGLPHMWSTYIKLTVDHDTCRDHFALEQTFLSYLRTSSILALTGVMIAQLHILQQPGEVLKRHETGMVLAMACYACAIWTLLCGACRFMRFQQALVRGKSLLGGVELMSPAMLVFTLLIVFITLHMKSDE